MLSWLNQPSQLNAGALHRLPESGSEGAQAVFVYGHGHTYARREARGRWGAARRGAALNPHWPDRLLLRGGGS